MTSQESQEFGRSTTVSRNVSSFYSIIPVNQKTSFAADIDLIPRNSSYINGNKDAKTSNKADNDQAVRSKAESRAVSSCLSKDKESSEGAIRTSTSSVTDNSFGERTSQEYDRATTTSEILSSGPVFLINQKSLAARSGFNAPDSSYVSGINKHAMTSNKTDNDQAVRSEPGTRVVSSDSSKYKQSSENFVKKTLLSPVPDGDRKRKLNEREIAKRVINGINKNVKINEILKKKCDVACSLSQTESSEVVPDYIEKGNLGYCVDKLERKKSGNFCSTLKGNENEKSDDNEILMKIFEMYEYTKCLSPLPETDEENDKNDRISPNKKRRQSVNKRKKEQIKSIKRKRENSKTSPRIEERHESKRVAPDVSQSEPFQNKILPLKEEKSQSFLKPNTYPGRKKKIHKGNNESTDKNNFELNCQKSKENKLATDEEMNVFPGIDTPVKMKKRNSHLGIDASCESSRESVSVPSIDTARLEENNLLCDIQIENNNPDCNSVVRDKSFSLESDPKFSFRSDDFKDPTGHKCPKIKKEVPILPSNGVYINNPSDNVPNENTHLLSEQECSQKQSEGLLNEKTSSGVADLRLNDKSAVDNQFSNSERGIYSSESAVTSISTDKQFANENSSILSPLKSNIEKNEKVFQESEMKKTNNFPISDITNKIEANKKLEYIKSNENSVVSEKPSDPKFLLKEMVEPTVSKTAGNKTVVDTMTNFISCNKEKRKQTREETEHLSDSDCDLGNGLCIITDSEMSEEESSHIEEEISHSQNHKNSVADFSCSGDSVFSNDTECETANIESTENAQKQVFEESFKLDEILKTERCPMNFYTDRSENDNSLKEQQFGLKENLFKESEFSHVAPPSFYREISPEHVIQTPLNNSLSEGIRETSEQWLKRKFLEYRPEDIIKSSNKKLKENSEAKDPESNLSSFLVALQHFSKEVDSHTCADTKHIDISKIKTNIARLLKTPSENICAQLMSTIEELLKIPETNPVQLTRSCLELIYDMKNTEESSVSVLIPPYLSRDLRILFMLLTTYIGDNVLYQQKVLDTFEENLSSFQDRLLTVKSGKKIGSLYTALCRVYTLDSRVRKTIYDVLYCRNLKAFPIIYTILRTWPEVLPKSHKLKDCIITETIVFLLLSGNRQQFALHLSQMAELCIIELRNLLNKKFGYLQDFIDKDSLTRKILEKIDTRAGSLSLMLLCKTDGWIWSKTIIEKNLLPVLNFWLEGKIDDDIAAHIALVIGKILRAFPITSGAACVRNVLEMYELLLHNSDDEQFCAKIVEAISHLRRHNLVFCAMIFVRWTPRPECVSSQTLTNMRKVMSVKSLLHWKNFYMKYAD